MNDESTFSTGDKTPAVITTANIVRVGEALRIELKRSRPPSYLVMHPDDLAAIAKAPGEANVELARELALAGPEGIKVHTSTMIDRGRIVRVWLGPDGMIERIG